MPSKKTTRRKTPPQPEATDLQQAAARPVQADQVRMRQSAARNIESQVADLQRASAQSIRAERVRMHQSAASHVDSQEVELHVSAAAEVRASVVDGHEAAMGLVQANEVWMSNSAAGAVQGENVVLDGGSMVVVGRTVSLNNAYTGAVAGGRVQADEIRTLLLLAGKVEGPVRTSLDTRQTLLAGLIAGLVAGTILAVTRRLSGRK